MNPEHAREALGTLGEPEAQAGGYEHPDPAKWVYPKADEWSQWFPFTRSSNVSMARYKLHVATDQWVWQVIFGGKPAKPSKKNPHGAGVTTISMYEYGPSHLLTDEFFQQWWNQYVAGGSAGIWLDLNVKRANVPARHLVSQGK